MLYESDPQNRMRRGSLWEVLKEALKGRRTQGLVNLKNRSVLRKQLTLCRSMSLCQIPNVFRSQTTKRQDVPFSGTHLGCWRLICRKTGCSVIGSSVNKLLQTFKISISNTSNFSSVHSLEVDFGVGGILWRTVFIVCSVQALHVSYIISFGSFPI